MGYTIVGLKEKILDAGKNGSVVKMPQGNCEPTLRLERQDADDCINGITCVSLGIQVEQSVMNFALREKL